MLEEQNYNDRIGGEEMKKESAGNLPESSGETKGTAAGSVKSAENLEQVCRSILVNTRNELYLKMRFLDVALSSFIYVLDMDIYQMGTDGFRMHYQPKILGGLYRTDRVMVNRLYLHTVLHCIFRHLIRRNEREKGLWDLSCNIAVESIIDSMNHRAVRRGRSWIRQELYRKLEKQMRVLTAEKIYAALAEWALPEQKLFRLAEEFNLDDHRLWPENDQNKKSEIENRWRNQSEQIETDMETFSKEGSSDSGSLLKRVRVENKERFNYQQFLRKFSVLREELRIDEDSFDYGFYSYGLRLYGNMPLIEPQEWKEEQKIEEFVIVIDTSMSCSGELVKQFLEETYSVLSENNSFFRKVNIHIIQCDETVKEDHRITCGEELKIYMEDLTLKGEGGTDFRPAFAYVDELMAQGELGGLKGLIYFTDGKGVYPARKPPYQTAFVFVKEDYEDVNVPAWAMKLILDEEALKKKPKEETGGGKWILSGQNRK